MRLLLVDDEQSLLQLLGQRLVRLGHVVALAANVAQAQAVLAGPYDAAIIDWTLPDGSGLDIGRALLENDNQVVVIFTSGYPLDAEVVRKDLRGRVRFLQKPFLPRALSEILSTLAAAPQDL